MRIVDGRPCHKIFVACQFVRSRLVHSEFQAQEINKKATERHRHEAHSGYFACGERAAWQPAHGEYITAIMRPAASACRDVATDPMPLRLFALDESRYALQLSAVERVLQLVDIVPLHGAPPIVSGVIDMRRRFGPAERPATLSDQLVAAPTPQRGRACGRRALQHHTDRIS